MPSTPPPRRWHPVNAVLVSVALLLTGCVTNTPDDAAQSSPSVLVAANVVSVLAQIDGVGPTSGPLSMRPPASASGQALVGALERAGYTLDTDDAALASRSVQHRQRLVEGSDGRTLDYTLIAGDIRIERRYRFVDDRPVPDSPMRIVGATQSGLELDDRALAVKGVEAVPAVIVLDEEASASVSAAGSGSAATTPVFAIPPETPAATTNRLGRRESAYASTLEDYDLVAQRTMTFARGDVAFSSIDWDLLREVVDAFDPQRDLVWLIGCSQGRTSAPGGNEALANARVGVVRDGLVEAGIDARRVLGEACWAGRYDGRDLPSRGVVVSHLRVR